MNLETFAAKGIAAQSAVDKVLLEQEARRKAIVALAKDEHEVEGEVEIDHNAQTSEGDDNGCYVAAWVWVDFSETPFDKNKEL